MDSGRLTDELFGVAGNLLAANLTTTGITWTAGTDDMSVSEETTMSDAISVGAYDFALAELDK